MVSVITHGDLDSEMRLGIRDLDSEMRLRSGDVDSEMRLMNGNLDPGMRLRRRVLWIFLVSVSTLSLIHI